ncbi:MULTISPECIES: ABC transporter substrate-binding protein [Halolamina]|uniref:Peptide/nickel transport system substrate-binding protein n=1 Tax=Halolamina pelagica TaxID=699431 RepID=A0A1I5MVP1_9EURY|nr:MULTISPECIES: ABC transporter substrate-binding protein [Halolamina]NHX36183.1 ABC transporter substrate-binding protein [Halolamina sp. R1-12]SFP13655.1 peptide/nickel transport system substrate-binding protein [Halolamina pelagica]
MGSESSVPTDRRSVLAALGSGATVLSAGCLQRARNLTGWRSTQPVTLRIKTLPTDADPYALALAREIASWFRAAGIETEVLPMAEQELMRQSLLRTEFEMFVMRLPEKFRDPDALTTLLHSRFADAPGWQNPFGYTNLGADEALERQRRADGAERRATLERLQRTVARTQPFTLLTVPDDIRAARTGAGPNWQVTDLRSPVGYLRLAGEYESGSEETVLRVVTTDRRATTNLNPLAVEFRRGGALTGLLYDPLARSIEGELTPWLAESIDLVDGDPPSARVTLREDVRWHDDEALTAADVAFTYDLLADTTLGDDEEDAEVPSPEFRGQSSLVDDVSVVDDRRLDVTFADADRAVVPRALTVPILPEHVWRDRTDTAAIGGIPVGTVTEALVSNNIPPVGSGPFAYVRNTPRESLRLERVEGHFSAREGADFPDWIADPAVDALSVRVVGSDVTAVETVADGEADVTGTAVGAATVPRIGRADGTELVVRRSDRPYVLGYNTRRPHLDNPRFRNTLARVVDEQHLGEHVLDGYARPAVGPLQGTEWYPEDLEWDGGNPVVPFFGRDGELNVEAVREAFREAGYQYEDGALVGGST